MGVGGGLYTCTMSRKKKFTFAISSPDEFLFYFNMEPRICTPLVTSCQIMPWYRLDRRSSVRLSVCLA